MGIRPLYFWKFHAVHSNGKLVWGIAMDTLCERNIQDPWTSPRYLVPDGLDGSWSTWSFHISDPRSPRVKATDPLPDTPTRPELTTVYFQVVHCTVRLAGHLAGIHQCSSSMLGHVDQYLHDPHLLLFAPL